MSITEFRLNIMRRNRYFELVIGKQKYEPKDFSALTFPSVLTQNDLGLGEKNKTTFHKKSNFDNKRISVGIMILKIQKVAA